MAGTFDISRQKKFITYRYVASTIRGETVKGTIKATDEVAAERLLIAKGHIPTQLEIAPSMFSLEEALPSLFKVKTRDVIVFSRQLATLLKSGISLLPSLDILQEQVASSRAFRTILGSVINDIHSGVAFSQAISKHPRAFSDIYCRTIAVGEETGNMETVLHQMADYMETQSEMAGKVQKALTYPMMVMGVGAVTIVILMTVVMPKLLGMFTAMSAELPLPTKMLMTMSSLLVTYKLYLLIAVALLVALVLWLAKQPAGRRLLDRLRLTAPVIGAPTLMTELGRFARSVSVLVGAGVQLQEIMEMLPQSTSNRFFRGKLEQVKNDLLLGEGLSQPMSRIDLFPPLLVQMVAVGEESNTLEFTMGVVADFFQTTAEEKTNALVGMIGPASTIIMALVVGFIALSVIMPMYTLTGAFG